MDGGTIVYLDGVQLQQIIDSIVVLQNLINALGYGLMASAGMIIFSFLSYGFWRYIFGRDDK